MYVEIDPNLSILEKNIHKTNLSVSSLDNVQAKLHKSYVMLYLSNAKNEMRICSWGSVR